MTSSTHNQYNYNRRNSTTSPYSIPLKNQQGQQVQGMAVAAQNPGMNFQLQGGGQISSSVPTLSREFVVRRISEGETGRLKEELKCEACGKGYKHISSLAKHLWEHTPEWNVTKKLLISKHQQVQLLEAASILVGMNETPSRRNSVFQDDDDVKYPSAFSPINSSETNPTSNTPTPSMNNEASEKENSIQESKPKFKNAFNSASGELYESSSSHIPRDYSRSDSISQYPPSEASRTQPSSLTTGGYLDNVRSRQESISGSMYVPNRPEPLDDFRSPPTSYKSNKLHHRLSSFMSSSTFNSPKLNSPERHNNDELEKEGRSILDDDNDGVIGKME